MKTIKEGGHPLFEEDPETSSYVADMLRTLRAKGMDAVRRYSRELDDWDPPSFELSEQDIAAAIEQCDDQLIQDTNFCQANVRAFAQAQLATLHPLEVQIRSGVTLGHKHIPVNTVGTYVPGGRYPMFGSAQMTIIPAKVAGVKIPQNGDVPAHDAGCQRGDRPRDRAPVPGGAYAGARHHCGYTGRTVRAVTVQDPKLLP